MSGIADRLSAALADRYRIERELGAGGMATVYLAQDLKHQRQVAIKVLKPELAAVLGAERFVQEITTTAQLQHPHILPLFDSGTADGFLFYVMPYIEGETLRDKLDRETQLGVDEAIRITTEVADALDYAHRQGVIHRDIKPENILLHDGRPMVADFGIALAVSAAAGGRMTETGMSLGTPHYMSPEQATADKDITGRSDIYSLASVLYEMLTGDPPHVGSSAQQIIVKIIADEARPVSDLRKSVPPNVAAAVAKALEKLPADRFESAKEFAEALADPSFTSAGVGPGGGGVPPSRRGLVTPILAGVAVLTAALAAWGWLRPQPAPPVISYGLALPAGQEPVVPFAVPPTAAPDGSYLIYVGPMGSAGTQLWIKRRDSHSAAPVAGTAGAAAFAIAPDGGSVAFVAGSDLRTLSLAGGAPVTLVSDSVVSGLGLAWLDDGLIAYVSLGERLILRMAPVGGGATVLVHAQDSLTVPAQPARIPGKSALLFHTCSSNLLCDLWVYDVRRDSARVVMRDAKLGQFASGYLTYLSGGGLMAVPFDRDALNTTGSPVSMTDSVAQFTLSPSGTLVEILGAAAGGATYEMVWVDRTGHRTQVDSTWTFRLTAFASNAGWALSPDGTRFAIGLNGKEGDDIWVKPLPIGPPSRVTFDPSTDFRPHWTPDGRSVLFLRAGARSGVMLRRADGTGSDSLLQPGTGFQEAVFSPDGQWLLVRQGGSVGSGGRDIAGLRLGVDSAFVPILNSRYDEEAVALSPDGHWIAYQSDETGRTEVFVRPFPNTDQDKRQVSSGGGEAPLWSRDGRELFYLSGAKDMMAVRVSAGSTLTLSQPAVLFRVPDDLLAVETTYYTPWDVAPDGRFLMARRVDLGPGAAQTTVVVENFVEELKARMRGGNE